MRAVRWSVTLLLMVGACLVASGWSTAEAAGARPVVGPRSVTVSERGHVVIRLACPRRSLGCRGDVALRRGLGRRPTLGSARFALRRGQTGRLAVRLNRPGLAVVVRRGTVRLQIVVATRPGSGAVSTARTIVLRRPAPPRRPQAVVRPPAATNDRSARFRFRASPGVILECRLDGRRFVRCGTSIRYTGLRDGDHVLVVRPRHPVRGVGAAARYRWRVGVAPAAPSIGAPVAALSAGAPSTFAFASSTPGVVFLCSLDGAPFVACPSTVIYGDLRPGQHTLVVKARDAAGRDSAPSSVGWTIAPPAAPTLTGVPSTSTTASTARLLFTHPTPGVPVTFLCSLDGGRDTPCTSPAEYRGLGLGTHTFAVKASVGGVESAPASATWTVVPLRPDIVGGIEDVQIKQDYGLATGAALFFSTDVINVGQGPLEIRTGATACQSAGAPGRVARQRIFHDGDGDGVFSRPADEGTSTTDDIGCIAYHAAHRHLHFQEFAVYELFEFRSRRRGELVSQSDKVSYCMIDEEPYNLLLPSAPPVAFYPYARVCQSGEESFMGVSVGWNDKYGHERPDQFVPLEGPGVRGGRVKPGTYCLVVRTDYRNRLAETNDLNNDVSVPVQIGEGDTVAADAQTVNRLRC